MQIATVQPRILWQRVGFHEHVRLPARAAVADRAEVGARRNLFLQEV